ncbi:LemA family protein [Candidatus Nanohalobium constans]|uniref:LemA protein n=1 Tax=Candidatus Nanohalobium constans TaxID=2565781 RepID=A0A5Q0UFS5_9ARCH|nr:LemA family protein [Candidatus Nanohalobium constans]QGA80446.1 LemA protein [Candidatus Nanohalobium constans]
MVLEYVALGAGGALILSTVYYYNKIVKLENRVDNAWAQIDVQLKKRADLVPNLQETVEGYMEHEREIMDNVSESRERMMNAQSQEEEVQAGNEMGEALKSLFAVAEDYPDLKASENFQQLQEELSSIENKIAYARQHYNDAIMTFNNAIETFPAVMFANIFGKTEKDQLEIETADKELPEVDFSDDNQ